MASQWCSALMVLASLMSLYWMTSAAQTHVPLTSHLTQVLEDTAKKLKAPNQFLKATWTLMTRMFKEKMNKPSVIIKSFFKWAELVDKIGDLVSAIVGMALAFIPQDDLVLKAVKEGFAEVNRKLDSLSIQIPDIETDVEWFNYVSIYSQDERHILNAWRRFSEILEASELLQSEKDKQRLAQTFISYYENTGAETGLINLYRYLTVNHTSLTININKLLTRKLKCDVGQIGKYNLYLSSLLLRGMVVNQFYWKLMGFNKTTEEANHVQMFKKVAEAQVSTIEFCLNRYEDYMKKDVIEIIKTLSPDDKETIAAEVKKSLDQKYNWYSWVVLVYDSSNEKNMLLYNMTKIPVGDIIVAVDYTLEGESADERIKEIADECFKDKDCKLLEKSSECIKCFYPINDDQHDCVMINFTDYGKVVYAAYDNNYIVNPKPFYNVSCYWYGFSCFWSSKLHAFIHYSKKLSVCTDNKCKNGNCVRLLNSNEMWCKCHDGYYGNTCEKKTIVPTGLRRENCEIQPRPRHWYTP